MLEKKLLFILSLINIMIAVLGVVLYFRMDRVPPVIRAEGAMLYTKTTTDAEVLSILSAVDETDGDVSNTLVIEKVLPHENENKVWITCGAKDKSNNVAKHTIAISCEEDFFVEEGQVFQLVAGEAKDMMDE